MSQAAGADVKNAEPRRSETVGKQSDAPAEQRGPPAPGAQFGARVIFDTLQYAMFDNVAEAFHFNADLNPDLTHVKQPVIQQWTEGERQRPVERLSAADFQRREQ